MKFKLGKKSFIEDKRDLLLSKYILHSALPPIPSEFKPFEKFTGDWGMMANDLVGDCTCADAGHSALLWNAIAGKQIIIPDSSVLKSYEDITGYNPSQTDANGNNPTDQGAQIRDVLLYMQKTGIIDSIGFAHKIDVFMRIQTGNIPEMKKALFLCDAVTIGLNLPETAQEQFQNEQPWTVINGAQIEGGHDVVLVGWDNDWIYFLSWGQIWKMDYNFFIQYCDEVWGKFSDDFLISGRSPLGLDRPTLISDLKSIY